MEVAETYLIGNVNDTIAPLDVLLIASELP
jgi:hypothetical protein